MCRFVYLSYILTFSLSIKDEYDHLMQTINQLNEKIRILQNSVATKDETIKALEQELNDCSDNKILPEESSLVIVVPSSDDLDHHPGKFG